MTSNDTRRIVRGTDPDTSHDAAAKVAPKRKRVRDAVLAIIRDRRGLVVGVTHEMIVDIYQGEMRLGNVPPASASSIRTRVSELVDEGLVEMVPDVYGKTIMGNRARLWRATDA